MKQAVAALAILAIAGLLLLAIQQALRSLWLLARAAGVGDGAREAGDRGPGGALVLAEGGADPLASQAAVTAASIAAAALDGEDRGVATLRDDLDRALRAVAEVRFDHATGKIDDAERRSMEARYQAQALQALRALRARGVGDVSGGSGEAAGDADA